MFAFFGLGLQEIILLAVLGGGIAAVVLIVFLAISARSSSRGRGHSQVLDERVEALEEETRRLRAEVDAARGKSSGPG
jgi:hypothetical protein